jgi:hypothetical protein
MKSKVSPEELTGEVMIRGTGRGVKDGFLLGISPRKSTQDATKLEGERSAKPDRTVPRSIRCSASFHQQPETVSFLISISGDEK